MNGDLFTIESFSTLAGASFGVYVVSNVIQYVFNFNPRWFGLGLAFVFSFLGVLLAKNTGVIQYVIAFLNGFLIYASSVGIVQVTGKNELPINSTNRPYGSSQDTTKRRSFRTKWF
jgi:hypothetical protein